MHRLMNVLLRTWKSCVNSWLAHVVNECSQSVPLPHNFIVGNHEITVRISMPACGVYKTALWFCVRTYRPASSFRINLSSLNVPHFYIVLSCFWAEFSISSTTATPSPISLLNTITHMANDNNNEEKSTRRPCMNTDYLVDVKTIRLISLIISFMKDMTQGVDTA